MTGNKWRVDRVHHVWPEPHHAWQVTEALARGVFDYHGPFPTWAEAMRYTDEQARTIAVTLPRLAPEEWTAAGNFRVIPEPPEWGDTLEVDELDADGAYFTIGAEDCEPLALALLAHARKDRN